jgi:hypothetical protein
MKRWRLFSRVWVYIAWYDMWIGVYIDHRPGWRMRLYIQPLPCCGIQVDLRAYDLSLEA